MLLDFVIALSCGIAGVTCGYFLHAGLQGAQPAADREKSQPAEPRTSVAAKLDVEQVEVRREQVSEAAERLRAYAYSMAADVDAHQTKVQAVNSSLTGDSTQSTEAVFEAINQLIEANEVMQSQLHLAQGQIHDQAMQIESAEKRAETDALTRVPNRGAFDKHFHRQHGLGAEKAGTLAILDVDHFKKFNDVYGHRAGDEVLKVVAGILHARLHNQGIVARFGGEEFAIVLDGCPIEKAMHLVDQARAAIGAREISFEDKRLRVTASAGIAQLGTGESPEGWLQRADDGLYKSKEAGRDCSHWMNQDEPILVQRAPEPKSFKPQSSASKTPASKPAGGASSFAEPPVTQGEQAKPAGSTADPKAAATKTFANLPSRDDLAAVFDDIRGRTNSDVSLFVMAIKLRGDVSQPAMRSLMQIVRATLRSVDRLGCSDESTFLVLMPSVDQATAHDRGNQIYRSAKSIGLGSTTSGSPPVTIGLSQAHSTENYDEVVVRSLQAAIDAGQDDNEPVLLVPSESLENVAIG